MSLQDRIQGLSRAFAADISAIVRASLVEAFERAGQGRTAAPARAAAVHARAVAPRGERSNGLAPNEKRSPMLIEKTTERLFQHIDVAPGERIEEIAQALGCSTRELGLPVKKLVAAGRIRTEGVKRATRYYPKAVG